MATARGSAGRSPWNQVILLTLLSLFSVAPLLAKRGLDVVTRTYLDAAVRVGSGRDPYVAPAEGRDWFKYSPAFAWLYQPWAALPPRAQAVLWAAVNAGAFWWGVSRWFRVERRWTWLEWVALVAVAMELDISLRYQQVNALIAGALLAGLAAYRDGRHARAGAWVGAAANLKILPVVFAGGLLWPPRGRYVGGLALALAGLCALPAINLGWPGTVALHAHWLRVLTQDLGARGLLDLRTVLQRLDWPRSGEALRWAVMAFSVIVFGGYRWRAAGGRNSAESKFDWGAWFCFGAAALLLLSPRTESPTFVLIAPAYLFLAARARGWGERAALLVLLVAITIGYTDLWPKPLWDPRHSNYASKTLGALGLWVWSGGILIGRGRGR